MLYSAGTRLARRILLLYPSGQRTRTNSSILRFGMSHLPPQCVVRTQQFRCRHHGHGKEEEDPYAVLGVSRNSSYIEVKTAFVEHALKHHPDRSYHDNNSTTTNSKETNTAMFIRVREAFEKIVHDHKTGAAGGPPDPAESSNSDAWPEKAWTSDAEFRAWFRHETSQHLTFEMCDETRAEVIRVYKTMSRGGNDRGGYWEMARQLTERETNNVRMKFDSRASITKLEAKKCATNLRRQRKR